MTSSRVWGCALVIVSCGFATAGHAQPSVANAAGPVVQPGGGGESVHPLWSALAPPAWLAEHRRLLVVSAPAPDESAQRAWNEALQLALVHALPGVVVELATVGNPTSSVLLSRLRAAGQVAVAGLSVAVRRDQQRVLLTAHYVDVRTSSPVEHVRQASAPLDAFLTRVVGGVPAVRASSVRSRALGFDAAGLLGAFAADLDGDQRDELIVARTPHVSVYSLESLDGTRLRVVRRARARWPSTRRAVPMVRRAVAWFSLREGRVVVTRSDREGDVALALLDGELRFEPVTSPCAAGWLFPDGCAHSVPGRDYFDGELLPAIATTGQANDPDREEDTEASDDATTVAPHFYTRSVQDIRQPSGSLLRMTALVTPRGTLVAHVAGQRGSAGRQGASLAAADVDADGGVDVLTSDYVRDGEEDRLRWHRVSADGRVTLLWESPRFQGAVLHSVAGDFLGTGRSMFVAFEANARGGSRIWVVD